MNDDLEAAVTEANRRVDAFAADLREQGIHVGLGKPARCVCCGEPWPCSSQA